MSSLSPLNFRGLLAQSGVTPHGSDTPKTKKKNRAIECWKCPECFEVHHWEGEAEECCAVKEAAGAGSNANCCPICAAGPWADARDAADCCLWKDMEQAKRYAAADAVKGGATWLEALGFNHLGLPS
jgi:hypothetical protein